MKSSLAKWITRLFLIIVATIILLILGVLLFLGPLTQYTFERYDQRWLGREISINDLNINVLNGNIYIGNLVVYEKDGESPFASFEQLNADAGILPLFSRSIEIHSAQMDRLHVRISQDSTDFNFDDLIERFTPDSTDTEIDDAADTTDSNWSYSILDMAVLDGKVDYYNKNLDSRIGAGSIDILCPAFLSEDPLVDLDVDLEISEGGSGQLNAMATLDLDAMTYSGTLDIDRLSFLPLEPYLKEYLNISDLSGFLNTDLRLGGEFTGDHCYEGSGLISIDDLYLSDALADSLFTFTTLELKLDTINSRENLHRIDSLDITDPFVRFELYAEGDNFSSLVKDELKRPPDTVVTRTEGAIIPGQEYFNVFIYLGQYASYLARSYVESDYVADDIKLTDGTIVFRDLTLDEEVMFLLQELDINSSKFDSRNERVNFEIGALINQSAEFNAEWSVDPRNVLEMDLNYELQGLTISSLSPYSVFYTAYPLVSGNLLFEGNVHISSRNLNSNNHLLIEDIDVARKRFNDPPYKLPIRLAVVLLRDLNGDIDLDIPVQGSLDNPKFNYGYLAWQVIKDLIVKAAAAPFRFLASIFKVDEESLKEVPYEYGDYRIDKERRRRMKNIARVLRNKKELALDYYPKSNVDLEKDFIAFDFVKRMYLDSLRTDSVELDSSYILALSPRDSALYQFILEKTLVEDQLAPVSKHCRSIMGQDSLQSVYDSVRIMRHDLFMKTLTEELEIDSSRIRLWDPGIKVTRDTINLVRPTYLLNFGLKD